MKYIIKKFALTFSGNYTLIEDVDIEGAYALIRIAGRKHQMFGLPAYEDFKLIKATDNIEGILIFSHDEKTKVSTWTINGSKESFKKLPVISNSITKVFGDVFLNLPIKFQNHENNEKGSIGMRDVASFNRQADAELYFEMLEKDS